MVTITMEKGEYLTYILSIEAATRKQKRTQTANQLQVAKLRRLSEVLAKATCHNLNQGAMSRDECILRRATLRISMMRNSYIKLCSIQSR